LVPKARAVVNELEENHAKQVADKAKAEVEQKAKEDAARAKEDAVRAKAVAAQKESGQANCLP
jgi:hypothetical protein